MSLWVEHVGDERDQRVGREELAAVVRLLIGELRQKILVDAPENVAGDPLQLFGVEGAQEVAENIVVQFLELLFWQHAAQAVVVGFNRLHGRDDRSGAVGAVGQGDQVIELRLGSQEDGTLLGEVLLAERAAPTAASRHAGGKVFLDGQIATVGVA